MLTFNIFAGTDVGLRANNEDNFTICPDLEFNNWMVPAQHQQFFRLSKAGSLLVVADGMGGQNAGEVASAIAIQTVQDMFTYDNLHNGILSSSGKIKNFLKKVIVEADSRVKETSKNDSSTEGMGSTIVMAWIVNQIVYVAWLGDSRAYCFVPGKGVRRLSKDHSFVQKLVDQHRLSDEEAMVHPDSNIITRSLGDVSQTANPDVVSFPLEKGEIILLCSDGLCGVCKDEVIGGILQEVGEDLKRTKEELIVAALNHGSSDNITVAMLRVVDIEEEEAPVETKRRDVVDVIKSMDRMQLLLALSIIFNIVLSGMYWTEKNDYKEQSLDYQKAIQALKSDIDSLVQCAGKMKSILKKKTEITPNIVLPVKTTVDDTLGFNTEPIQQNGLDSTLTNNVEPTETDAEGQNESSPTQINLKNQ